MADKKICLGTGLICLDVVVDNDGNEIVPRMVGGTCGNVMMILSYMGWNSYPMARLDKSEYSKSIISDMTACGVHVDFIRTEDDGATPVIVQHNAKNWKGESYHWFSYEGVNDGKYPNYKPITKKVGMEISEGIGFIPSVFFFDRINPATIAMSKYFHDKGVLVFFEPQSVGSNAVQFKKCVDNSDIIKFSSQRMKDATFTDEYKDKLFVNTIGGKGLRFKLLGGNWINMPSVPNNNVVDACGAGDWTSASLINSIVSSGINDVRKLDIEKLSCFLNDAQSIASKSCSFNGARGMMSV